MLNEANAKAVALMFVKLEDHDVTAVHETVRKWRGPHQVYLNEMHDVRLVDAETVLK